MAKYSAGVFLYEFEELQIVPDHDCWVNGDAQISYQWEPDDPDTGYRGGFELEIESIRLWGTTKEATGLYLPGSHPLYRMIEEALLSDKYSPCIVGEIEKNHW